MSDEYEEYLHWISPIARRDYEAVVLGDMTHEERADERGVTTATITTNINNAKRRLSEIARQEGGETQ